MDNVVIIGVVVILLVVGGRSTIKHMKGEGACCGGGSTVKPKKKKLTQVVQKKIVKIDGMHCEQCSNRVVRSLNELDGVAAKVNLGKKEAVVSCEKEVSDEVIREAIEALGYEVLEIM